MPPKPSAHCLAVGNYIRECRTNAGLNLATVGRHLGITGDMVTLLEKGLASPSLTQIMRLKKLFPNFELPITAQP